MPRNASNVYSKPAGTTFTPSTVIESAKVNEVIDDIAADLNIARPITAGGTGASTAAGARTALAVYSTTEVDDAIAALDTDFAAKADKATTITAGDGLTGGGSLASSRTVSADIADSSAIAAGTAKKLVDAAGLKAVTDALPSPIGVGQTWQDVTASRSSGTSYQNTTGKPIMVNITGGNSLRVLTSTNGSSWSYATAADYTHSLIIPTNSYYKTESSVTFWAELR